MTLRSDSGELSRQAEKWTDAREKWHRMPRWQQAGVAALAAAEVVLTTRAAMDLARRDRTTVRGPKLLWWPVLTVQPFGPVVYLLWGRAR
jgi:hypothetical protein